MSEPVTILFTILWLFLGVLLMRYANAMKQKQKLPFIGKCKHLSQDNLLTFVNVYSKIVSYNALLLFMLAALTIYITDITIQIYCMVGIVICIVVILIVGYCYLMKKYHKEQ